MPLFKRRGAAPSPQRAMLAYWLSRAGSGSCPPGYTRLLDCPEISGVINRISSIIASATIYLMKNTDDGDKRVRDALARKVDVDPWRMGTRQSWMGWIVTTLLGEGDGNAFVLPRYDLRDGLLLDLEPMPGAVPQMDADRRDYSVRWQNRVYDRDRVLHFRLFPDPDNPILGRGYRITAQQLAEAMAQTDALKSELSSPDYRPPMVVYADVDTDLFDDEKREAFRRRYLEDEERGKPWILPAEVIKVDRFDPLSLTDLAVKDTIELNRSAVAALFGVPPFFLGVGTFSREEYNTFIRSVILPICQGITQTLTRGLLESDDRYFVMAERRLYAYTPMELVTMGLAMADRGYMHGDEVRDWAMLDPAGLKEYRALENYIPYDMAALQNKLTGGAPDA